MAMRSFWSGATEPLKANGGCEPPRSLYCLCSEQLAEGKSKNDTPLVNESAIGFPSSTESLLLNAFNLDNDAVLDNYPDFTILDAANGLPDTV